MNPFLVLAIFAIAHTQSERLDRVHRTLVDAVLRNDPALLAVALEAGANPELPLQFALEETTRIRRSRHPLRNYLLFDAGLRPLHIAAGLGSESCVNLLLASGAHKYPRSAKWKWTPAQLAAAQGHPHLIRRLLAITEGCERYRINILLSDQTLTLYKDGQVLLQAQISTGRKGYETPTGTFIVTDKELSHRSSLYKVKMNYFMRLSFSAIGIHHGVNPGHPASHGCIRVQGRDTAQRLYQKTPIGTAVLIN
jgi:lipoprotein-anchoring transpeptidase ErfK/SrfK